MSQQTAAEVSNIEFRSWWCLARSRRRASERSCGLSFQQGSFREPVGGRRLWILLDAHPLCGLGETFELPGTCFHTCERDGRSAGPAVGVAGVG